MTTILLIRHGETEWNVEGRIQGYADSPLTEAGRAQARALAARFALERPDALVSSDLGRARLTAQPIAEATGIAMRFDAGLRERNYGAWEGRSYHEVKRDYPVEYARVRQHDPTVSAQHGESALQFAERIIGALERIAHAHEGARVAVVTHGGVLGVMYRHAMGLAHDAPRTYTIANASINRVRFDRGDWTVEHWGDVAHLEAPQEESAGRSRSLL